MKAIILEDEQIAANRLKRMITEVAGDIKIQGVFESMEDTREFLKNNDVELLFFDIHVADGNSFDLFDLNEIKGKVIFTTAYDQYAIDAFRMNAIDYLLKPIKKNELAEAIEKATSTYEYSHQNDLYKRRLIVSFMSKIYSIRVDEIAFVYSSNKISYFYLTNGERIPSDYKLQELESVLDPSKFFRANRQFIIHIDAIESIIKYKGSRVKITLIPEINKKLIISTEKTPLFKQWLDR